MGSACLKILRRSSIGSFGKSVNSVRGAVVARQVEVGSSPWLAMLGGVDLMSKEGEMEALKRLSLESRARSLIQVLGNKICQSKFTFSIKNSSLP